MKHISKLLLFVFVVTFTQNAKALPQTHQADQSASIIDLQANDILTLPNSKLESILGRKLSIKDKLSLKLIKQKLRKQPSLSTKDAQENVKFDGMAITGFVLGILSLFLGPLASIPAIIFSAIGLNRIKHNPNPREGRGLALAGLIIGIVYTALFLLIIGLIFAFSF